MGALTTVAAQMSTNLRKRLEAIAEKDDRTLSYVIRQAVKEYVETREANGEAA